MSALDYKKKSGIVSTFFRMIGDCFRCIPGQTILFSVIDIIHAASYVAVVYFAALFFDRIAAIANGKSGEEVFIPLLFFIISSVFAEAANGLSNYHVEFLSPKMLSKMNRRVFQTAARTTTIEYENVHYLNLLDKARAGTEHSYFIATLGIMLFTFYFPYFIFMGIYLSALSPLLISVILLIFFPVLLGQIIRYKLFSDVEDYVTPLRRAAKHYEEVICDRRFFKETRLLGAFSFFFRLYGLTIRRINEKSLSAEKKHLRIDLCLRLITITGYVGILVLLTYSLIKGEIGVGAFAAVVASVDTMYSLADEVFGGFIGKISRYTSTLQNYQKYVNLPETHESSKPRTFSDRKIILTDVHFSYPNALNEALCGINLTIQEGESVAIVGENGAGKTTLAKIILGIYSPNHGTITLPLEETSDNHTFSAIFQKYQRYKTTLAENIFIGDVSETDDHVHRKVEKICEKANIDIRSDDYPNGMDTLLSREFGGTDLSGGQWQRVRLLEVCFAIMILSSWTSRHQILILSRKPKSSDNFRKYRTEKHPS
jgi:ATP-binding cassette subfamily B protein